MNKNDINEKPASCQVAVSSCVFGDSETEILKLENESVDIICIDPPYLYLKNQKLEREFNENKFFEQCKRILKPEGFVIMFGRGTSFYRWNVIIENLGFNFKEEIVWDKSYSSSPVLPISRVHETISIFSKGNGIINKVKIPYLEQKGFNIDGIISDIKRIKTALNNTEDLSDLLNFIESKSIITRENLKTKGNKTTVQSKLKQQSQSCKTLQSIVIGMNEKSIIKELREHYKSIHPTQKPVKLLERLIMLCLPTKPKSEILVVDFFAGSFSCGEACYNLGINFKGYEIDKEYYENGVERMEKVKFQTKLF